MTIDAFSLHCDALDGAKLTGFKGFEALNRPFEFDVFFTVSVGTDVKSAVGARATLTADREDGRGPMCWQGILAGVQLLHETAERTLYRGSLVPKLWVLQQYVRSYVHTKKKIDAFVADTLKDGGLIEGDFQFSTNAGAYLQEEFVCQYRESHLDFIHRWFEREGLYYYFEHPEGPGAAERLVIIDDKAQHGSLRVSGHVRYFPSAGLDAAAGECLRELHADFRLLPASVLISDYNYANPSAPVAGERTVSKGGEGKIREYGYRVFNDGEAKRLAQIKAQSMACRELVLSASGTYLGLRAGYTFVLEDGPGDLPAEYLAIEVKHAGAVSGASPLVIRYTGLDPKETYRVDVVAIPSTAQFRAPQSTAWPRIYGFENGTVDGSAESQYAQVDDQGRYLVRFKFDVSDLPDGSTSTYLRMMQPHGGTTEGWHFPLRKGTEVMVSFQGGDPDRPVIAGVVPNALAPSNVTSKNHTQNVLRTGSGNSMVMEDQEGIESVSIYTPVGDTQQIMGKNGLFVVTLPPGDQKDAPQPKAVEFTYFVSSEGTAGFNIGGDWWQTVKGGYFVDIGQKVMVHYGSTQSFRVDGESTEHYNAFRNTEMHTGYRQMVTPNGEQFVKGDWKHQVTGTNEDDYGTWLTSVRGPWTANVSGAIVVHSDQTVTIEGKKIVLDAPEVLVKAPKVETMAGFIRGIGSSYAEAYGSRSAAGIHKSDYAAFYTCGYGIKLETSGAVMNFIGIKGERYGTREDLFGVLRRNGGLLLDAMGISSTSAGLVRLG